MLQLIAANLPPEIGRQLTNVCTVRFGTKAVVCGPRLLIFIVLFRTVARAEAMGVGLKHSTNNRSC